MAATVAAVHTDTGEGASVIDVKEGSLIGKNVQPIVERTAARRAAQKQAALSQIEGHGGSGSIRRRAQARNTARAPCSTRQCFSFGCVVVLCAAFGLVIISSEETAARAPLAASDVHSRDAPSSRAMAAEEPSDMDLGEISYTEQPAGKDLLERARQRAREAEAKEAEALLEEDTDTLTPQQHELRRQQLDREETAGREGVATASAESEHAVGPQSSSAVSIPVGPSGAYAMVSFRNGKTLGDGLRLLLSTDGFKWTKLAHKNGSQLMLPLSAVAGARVFRDPSFIWHDGRFHLVFTTDLCVDQVPNKWACKRQRGPRPPPRFGYATSTDLVHWTDVRMIPVQLEHACSIWAPEISLVPADAGSVNSAWRFVVLFSATQHPPNGHCPSTMKESSHEPFFVVSTDMRTVSAPTRMRMPIEDDSIIDLFLLPTFDDDDATNDATPPTPSPPPTATTATTSGAAAHSAPSAATSSLTLFYKAERNACDAFEWHAGVAAGSNRSCSLVLKQAKAQSLEGPWVSDRQSHGLFFPNAISRPCVEGAALLRLGATLKSGAKPKSGGKQWLLLFDQYRDDCSLFSSQPCGYIDGVPIASLALKEIAQHKLSGMCEYRTANTGIGGMLSDDLQIWREVSWQVEAPAGFKHGTAVRLHADALRSVCARAKSPFASTPLCSKG